MSTLNLFISILLSNTSPVIELNEAIKTGKINVEVSSNGNGLSDGMLTAQIQNTSTLKITLKIPVGQVFICEEDPRQNLIIVQEEIMALNANQKLQKNLLGMCIEAGDMSPGSDIRYKPGSKANGDLLACAQFINTHQLYNSTGQNAIWVFTDNHEIGWIDAYNEHGTKLREYVAKLKGVENPWYSTSHIGNENHQLSDTYNASQPVLERYHMTQAEINGNFAWELKERTKITFAIYNSQGQLIRTFFNDKVFNPGELSMRFHYKATHIARGTYFARITNGEQVIAQREFTF